MVASTRGEHGKFVKNTNGSTGVIGEIHPTADAGTERQSAGGSETTLNPEAIDRRRDEERKSGTGRPRGRPPKEERPKISGGSQTKAALDLSALNAILFSSHQLLAGVMRAPEMKLTEDESLQLAKASTNVARHYNITASEKVLDWGNLILCLGVMYGSRFSAIGERKKKEREERKRASQKTPAAAFGLTPGNAPDTAGNGRIN